MDSITVDLGLTRGGRAAARRARDPDRRPGQRADHRRGGRAAPGHDQLRGHLRADAARAARLPPRRRAARRPMRRRARPDGGRRTQHERAPSSSPATRSRARRAWLVGGAVRDRLLGRATRRPRPRRRRRPGAGRARARPRAAAARACFALSEEFGAWRVVARDRAWQVDVEPLRGAIARGGPRAARLHGQRDRRAARRRGADRPARRARGPARRGACGWPAPGAFARGPAAGAAPGARRRRARPRAPTRETLRGAARARRRRCAACRAERVFVELRRILAAPRARGGARAAGASWARRPWCCPSSRRCAASSRTASTTSTSTATRSRCSTGRSS